MKIAIRNLYQSPIFKQYLTLSHIIFKQKYLIPQRPLPQSVLSQTYNLTQREIFAKLNPDKIQSPTFQAQLKQQNYSSLVKQLREKQKQLLGLKLQKYQQKYISPLVQFQKKILPYEIYCLQQSIKGENGKLIQPRVAQKLFARLPSNSKLKYQLKCKQLVQEKIPRYEPIAARYRIPKIIDKSPQVAYNESLEKSRIKIKEMIAFDKLPYGQQEKFRDLVKQKKEESINQLQLFLSRNKLSQAKFSEILQTCLNFSKEIKIFKSEGKLQESSVIQRIEQDPKIWLEFFDLSLKEYESVDTVKKRDASTIQATKPQEKQQQKLHLKDSQALKGKQKEKKDQKKNTISSKKQIKDGKSQQLQAKHSQDASKMARNQSFERKSANKQRDLAKHETDEVFDEAQCLNYDYEQIRLLREINKKLKVSVKNQSDSLKYKK